MRNIKSVINEYLSKPSDFAIQIVGGWGWGKTYYYKQEIEAQIHKTKTYNNEKKFYKPLYISLFGLKSTEDIATKIVIEFFQSSVFRDYAKRKDVRTTLSITESVFKIGARGFLNFFKLGSLSDYMTEIKKIGKNVLDTNELVVCFDDLDRKDSQLKIEDLAGYINNMVDERIKVILIANEKVLESSEKNYEDLKEKVIGITIPFLPDIESIIRNIIAERYVGFKTYQEFLNNNLSVLSIQCKANETNFRHLIYSLDRWHECYSVIRSNILDMKDEMADFVTDRIIFIFRFTMAVASEFKASRLQHSDSDAYMNQTLSLAMMFDDDKNSVTKADRDNVRSFLTKYQFNVAEYQFYNSIFQYVTGADDFNIDDFAKEFINVNNLERGRIMPQYITLNELGYDKCYDLSDEGYIQNTKKMIDYAKTGMYHRPLEYLNVMHFCERMNNLAGLNLDEVLILLKEGISIAAKNSNDEQTGYNFEFMHSRQSNWSERVAELYMYGKSVIEDIDKKREHEKMNNILKIVFSNDFREKYFNDTMLKASLENPIFKSLDLEFFRSYINKSGGLTLQYFFSFIKDRYESNYMLERERDVIVQMAKIIEEHLIELKEKQGRQVRSFLVEDFCEWARSRKIAATT